MWVLLSPRSKFSVGFSYGWEFGRNLFLLFKIPAVKLHSGQKGNVGVGTVGIATGGNVGTAVRLF